MSNIITSNNYNEIREAFIKVYSENIKREGADELLNFLDSRCDFFTAPASSRYHNCFKGGLASHSLNVYYALKDFLNGEFANSIYNLPKYSDETIAIVSLLHDMCKINYYKEDYRNVKNENGIWEKVPCYKTEDTLPYGHGEKSVWMLSGFMKLSREEAMAIRWHMGFSDTENKGLVGSAFEKYPLAFALSTADMCASYYLEGRETP